MSIHSHKRVGLLLSVVCSFFFNSIVHSETLSEDVVAGEDSMEDLFGFMQAAFVIGTLNRDEWGGFYPIHQCGATMVQRYTPILLVTAAHCVKPIKGPGGGWSDPRNQNEYWAFRGWVGAGYLSQWVQPGFAGYRVEEVYFPNVWRQSNQPVFADIAIVRLGSGEDGPSRRNLPIPTPQFVSQLQNHPLNPDRNKQTFKEEITGWGKESIDSWARNVKKGVVYDIPLAWCRKMVAGYEKWLEKGKSVAEHDRIIDGIIRKYHGKSNDRNLVYELTHRIYDEMFTKTKTKPDKVWVFDDEVCAMDIKQGRTSNCYGDSGGPLVYAHPNQIGHTLMGVTSSSIVGDCSPKVPVMYSNLAYFGKWIKSMHSCIMLDQMKQWETKIKAKTLAKELDKEWSKMAEFWRNENRIGGSQSMVDRSERNRVTEYAFRKFYVDYMQEFKPVMKKWCEMKPQIENLYLSIAKSKKNGALQEMFKEFPLKDPGFFPSLIVFSEWVGEPGPERYRRAWAHPYRISDELILPSQSKLTRISLMDNIAISFDMEWKWKSESHSVRLVLIDGGIPLVVVKGYTLFFWASQGVCVVDLRSWGSNKKIHVEIVLQYLHNDIKIIFDGQVPRECHNTEIEWRKGLSSPIGNKAVIFGESSQGTPDPSFGTIKLSNIEVRTWIDPPVCCSEFNIGDGKCIKGC